MSLSIEEVMSEAGDSHARSFIEHLEEKETDFSFEHLAGLGNNAVAAFVEGFHAVFIPWVARAIAEQRDAAIDSAIDDERAGDDL
jgi:NAD(P)H-hydrate repair Nnr-like enzyme with NAD(P)H-hydrate epimerase domain